MIFCKILEVIMFEHVVSKKLRHDFNFDLSCCLEIWLSRDENKFETHKNLKI